MRLYDRVTPAVFIARPNRFIARVAVDGREEELLVAVTPSAAGDGFEGVV